MSTFAEAAAAAQAAQAGQAAHGSAIPSALPTPAVQPSPPPTTPMQGTHPSGQTPNAKRVRAREADTLLQAPAASMTVDDLSDGFHALFAQVQIGAKFSEDMGEAVT